MPTFRYTTLGQNGAADAIDAPDRATAVRSLRQRGITPTRVEQVSGRDGASIVAPARPASKVDAEFEPARRGESNGPAMDAARPITAPARASMSKPEMAMFIRELATATQAGLPLVPALRTILRQHRQPRQRAVLSRLIDAVEHGRSLADAAAGIGRPFTELTVSMLRAGEMSGRLSEVLDQTATLLDRDIKTRRTVVAGLIYPGILAVLIAGALVVISTFIVPRILATFTKASAGTLPWPTRIVMGFTNFVGVWWWAILLAVALAVLLARALYRQTASRLSIDRAMLSVPLLGRVLRDVAVARFTRTLGTLVSAGLPALTALKITRNVLGNKALEGAVAEVCEQVASGKTIADQLERSGYFPPLLTQIVGLGERSGRLPQMLGQAADVFEDRTENSIKVFTAAFPPLMVVVAAVVIGFVIAAVLLPLIQAQELIG